MYQLTKLRLVAAATYLPEDYLRLRLRFAKPRLADSAQPAVFSRKTEALSRSHEERGGRGPMQRLVDPPSHCYGVTWVRLRVVENRGSDDPALGSGARESRWFCYGVD